MLVPTEMSKQFNLCTIKAVNMAIGDQSFATLGHF